LLPPNAKRLLAYLDAIEAGKGQASRMDLLRIAGSETNLNRALRKLIDEFRLVEEIAEGDKKRYKKTSIGEAWHAALKTHEYVGPLIDELGRGKFRSS